MIKKTQKQIRWENQAYLNGELKDANGKDLSREEIEYLYKLKKYRKNEVTW